VNVAWNAMNAAALANSSGRPKRSIGLVAELHLAQPSLSRQIQRLKDRLGVRLLDRTPQGSRLTEAGKAFLPQAQALLHAARQAALTARAYAPAAPVFESFEDRLELIASGQAIAVLPAGDRRSPLPPTWPRCRSRASPPAASWSPPGSATQTR
jgi:hypothetical protein